MEFDLFHQPEYFNTTNAEGVELDNYKMRANSVMAKVFEVFKSNPDKGMTWSDVKMKLGKVNESSLKRSITVLKNKFLVVKTDEKALSSENATAHKYKLNKL